MHVWNVLHAARWNKGRITQKSTSAHHRTNLSGYMFASKAFIDNGKKILKQQHLLHVVQCGELRSVHYNGWDRLASLGHPSKFQQVSRLISFVTAPTSLNWSQPNFARCMAGRPSSGLVYYIHIFGGTCPPNRILPRAKLKFTLRPTHAFSYIGSVTARHSSSGRQLNFAAEEWN